MREITITYFEIGGWYIGRYKFYDDKYVVFCLNQPTKNESDYIEWYTNKIVMVQYLDMKSLPNWCSLSSIVDVVPLSDFSMLSDWTKYAKELVESKTQNEIDYFLSNFRPIFEMWADLEAECSEDYVKAMANYFIEQEGNKQG